MSERTPALDKLDRAILRRLQDNGRETYDVIGEQVACRPAPCCAAPSGWRKRA